MKWAPTAFLFIEHDGERASVTGSIEYRPGSLSDPLEWNWHASGWVRGQTKTQTGKGAAKREDDAKKCVETFAKTFFAKAREAA